ncbi:hypothetical protein HOO54_09330 [Bacillus sp. WMMC1349]|uniref:hypothetical protein n=1 Tax=Bacillus sp. WMMC1349 TaxID=2736254 RepID=UPI0015555754|nr:hypothetical protein [Bacillus sp. WMMC1349]NPC92421.1 hypothetical protein [Bacillus sp. WMMC1349]
MSLLTIIEVITLLTILGLFAWTFTGKEHEGTDLKYGRYMIYLLMAEVTLHVLFHYI